MRILHTQQHGVIVAYDNPEDGEAAAQRARTYNAEWKRVTELYPGRSYAWLSDLIERGAKKRPQALGRMHLGPFEPGHVAGGPLQKLAATIKGATCALGAATEAAGFNFGTELYELTHLVPYPSQRFVQRANDNDRMPREQIAALLRVNGLDCLVPTAAR